MGYPLIDLDDPARAAPLFWAYVDCSGECWPWRHATNAHGYGYFATRRNGRRKIILAHRAAWTLIHGAIPAGLYVCHQCDNPPCCRPEHLFLGTQADNMRDAAHKGRVPRADTHVWHLHPEKVVRGEARYGSKLTAEMVREIRQRFEGGTTQKQLAADYGVQRQTIQEIVYRKRWKHVD